MTHYTGEKSCLMETNRIWLENILPYNIPVDEKLSVMYIETGRNPSLFAISDTFVILPKNTAETMMRNIFRNGYLVLTPYAETSFIEYDKLNDSGQIKLLINNL